MGMREGGAAQSQVGRPVPFSLFILLNIFQVCWVWTPISKAILKHIKPESK